MGTVTCGAQALIASDPDSAVRWDELVDEAPTPDVYCRSGYAMAAEAAGHGKAIGLVLHANQHRVLLPLLLRPLAQLPFASDESGLDAITPYGYGGLLPLSGDGHLTTTDVGALFDALQDWCAETGIVSCFVRLHPLLQQERWLSQDELCRYRTVLHARGSTIGVDLANWDCVRHRLMGLQERRRRALVRAQRWLRVSWSGLDLPLSESLALFRQIYEQRMSCLNASAHYFFPSDYYASLERRSRDDIAVALAWLDRTVVAGSLFIADRRFAHYHLGGSDEQGRELGAGTLLMNAGARWARERGCTHLHLGGGLTEGDSLFEFKRSFGGAIYPYHTLGVIADAPRYFDLVERRTFSPAASPVEERFFPQYRARVET